ECERIGVTTPLPPVPHCPAGYVGKYPDCRKRVSPHCPKGTVGRYPKCRKVILRTPHRVAPRKHRVRPFRRHSRPNRNTVR
ncbi:MAG: hypothetical protein P8Y36_02500, partial [Alphaproteobacteria bacterium]